MDITIEELRQIYYINKEIESLYKELAELRQQSFIKPVAASDMPRGGEHKDMLMEYTNEVLEIENLIQYSLLRLQRERKKAERFLAEVEDPEMRLIIRLRCINNMTWEDIGTEIGCERTTASKKFYKYFDSRKVSHNSH